MQQNQDNPEADRENISNITHSTRYSFSDKVKDGITTLEHHYAEIGIKAVKAATSMMPRQKVKPVKVPF
jgi:hypothetical protein